MRLHSAYESRPQWKLSTIVRQTSWCAQNTRRNNIRFLSGTATYASTVKPLTTNIPKKDYPLFSRQITCPPVDITLELIHLLQKTNTSQPCTLNTDQPKTYLNWSETTPSNSLYIMQTLIDHFCKIVHHNCWIQMPGIILALLLIILVSYHHTALESSENVASTCSTHTTTPIRSIPKALNYEWLCIQDTIHHTAVVPMVSA